MALSRKAIIIGAGPAGLATALRIQQTSNITCTIYELRPEPTTLGGAIGILSNGLRLLHRLGVYDALTVRGSTRGKFVIRSMQGNILGEQADTMRYARERTGFGYMRIKRIDLVDVLLEAVREAGIPVNFDKRITGIEDENREGGKAVVTFSDGTTDTADLVIGCDGIHSSVRRLYVDPGLEPEYSGICGLFSIVSLSKFPASAAEQLDVGMSITLTEEGVFAATSCTEAGDEVFWGLSREVALPDSGNSRDGWEVTRKEEVNGFKTNLNKTLENAQGDWGATLRQLVDHTDSVKFYPVHRLPLGGAWHRGRCILLGDAAHAMQPHAGQGVSMVMEDTFLLSRLLEDPTRPLDEVFEKFDAIRRPRVNEIYELSARNGESRKNMSPWGLWVKEVMVRIAFLIPWAFGSKSLGLGQTHLVYDVDEAEI